METNEALPEENVRKDDLAVVGIGASAGGLCALRTFFEAVPAGTGIVFVVVIHLSPEHESSMAELLQNTTAIPVLQVTERTAMKPDHIYIIPPNKNLKITDGHLILTEFEEPRGRRAPIDVFFRTLAETHPDGIGILFSGGGTDGTVGMKAIKEHGGLLMAQLPEEAEYDQMPRNAIATGLVDFVMPAHELAEKLIELRQSPAQLPLPDAQQALPESDEQVLKKILTQLQTRSGYDFSGYKRSMMLRRLARRMRVTSAENLSAYLGYLHGNAAETRALLKDFLISVTNFFRDDEAFEALAKQVIPKLFHHKTFHDEVRVWVPGCATGEEAYSIAMLLLEAANEVDKHLHIQIFASDIDEDALTLAREGLYPETISADVSEERLKRFFTKEGSYYRVGKDLREAVLFATHSLLKDPPFSKQDLISCRNLLIYLQRNLQQKIFELFYYALRPGGYLFLGSSESAEGTRDLFHTLDKTHRLYQRQRTAPSREGLLPDLPLAHTTSKRIKASVFSQEVGQQQAGTDYEVHRQALEAYAPPSLIVNRDHTIVHLSKTAGRYLQIPGGSPTMSAVKVIRKELRIVLRTALYDALENGEATITRAVEMQIEGEPRLVQLHVRPVPQENAPSLALVIFAEGKRPPPNAARADASATAQQVRQVEEELEMTRERLQATIEESETQHEELKATNEELQSINEEYKSALEELETSKEELQSINEELKTVNQELEEKVEALSRANNDLNNLMAATDVATLFLDRQLKIKRFTPPLAKIFNIMPVDRGRPLAHVTHRLAYDSLAADARHVLDSLVPVEHDLRDEDGRHYLMQGVPYRTADDRIEGVVFTFVDVTRLKQAQEELHRTQERYLLLIENVKEYAIFIISEEGGIASWNAGAEHLFGYTEEEALGQPIAIIYTEDDRTDGVPEAELETARESGQALDERWHVRKNGTRFWGAGIMTALHDRASGELQGYAKVLRDNTRRRESAEALRQSQERLQKLNETLEARVEARTAELARTNAQVRDLAATLTQAEQEERRRISQILHDDLQQRLYGVSLKMSFVRRDAEAGKLERLLEDLAEATEWLNTAVAITRQLTVDLSPPVLKTEGLTEMLNWLRTQMHELHDLTIDLKAAHPFIIPDENMRVLLFQAVRELLFNVVKHAQTDHATVEIDDPDGHLIIRVLDHGQGFDVEEAEARRQTEGGFGLFSVRERLRLFGGSMKVVSAPGTGTRITIHTPVEPQQPDPAGA